ncbi:uncharacterized protein LOC135121761 isoform X2 [Zophobas morio]
MPSELKSEEGPKKKSHLKKVSLNLVLDESVIKKFREDNVITVESDYSYTPVVTFKLAQSLFSKELLQTCRDFKKPSPIQAEVWPVSFTGKDVIGIAVTGSGKTLAFALTSVRRLQARKSEKKFYKNSPIVLILAPTRELASQIHEVFEEISTYVKDVRCVCIYGGVSKMQQVGSMSQSFNIMVATPGRLLGLVESGNILLSRTSILVLDEADRMLDKGFEPDIRKVISHLKNKRQILMFSATWPNEVQLLAKDFLRNPVKITIGGRALMANPCVTQHVEVLLPPQKRLRLLQLLKKLHTGKNRILIFVLYKKEVPQVAQFLQSNGYAVCAVHGDMPQPARTSSVNSFKRGKIPILIATDVCSRGLDIPKVEFVINYTFPLTVEDYVHRIGRTGRAGEDGVAYTFFTDYDKHLGGALCDLLKSAHQEIPAALEKFLYAPTKAKRHKLYGHIVNDSLPLKAPTRILFED